ncbi:MAG: hypothetical protein GEU90_14895 [Gemmatimonas sp.]|nr:hypothetical protein [Gemmatimonas sp.]
MKRFFAILLLVLPTAGCASMGFSGGQSDGRMALWARAQNALAAEEFLVAEGIFEEVIASYPSTLEARESLFYLGSLRLDPRNPDWDPIPAEARLAEYISLMERGAEIFRYPEARTLHELARQLNMPPESRVAGLAPEERVVTVEERLVVPGTQTRELSTQVAELQRQLEERDARIQQQQEELDRIRRTLTAPGTVQ